MGRSWPLSVGCCLMLSCAISSSLFTSTGSSVVRGCDCVNGLDWELGRLGMRTVAVYASVPGSVILGSALFQCFYVGYLPSPLTTHSCHRSNDVMFDLRWKEGSFLDLEEIFKSITSVTNSTLTFQQIQQEIYKYDPFDLVCAQI